MMMANSRNRWRLLLLLVVEGGTERQVAGVRVSWPVALGAGVDLVKTCQVPSVRVMTVVGSAASAG
jgi:hypothetical protein